MITYSKAYVIAVDMGYGHQRAAFPLLKIAGTPDEWNIKEPMIISANNYPGIPKSDKTKWHRTQKTYEGISHFSGFPFLGKVLFHLMDYIQEIEPFYPKRDLSRPTLETKLIYRSIRHGLGKHLIETLNKNPLPLICTFPIPALFAEEHGYKGEIYCLCTDTDNSRAWAPLHPEKSRIIYLAPTTRTKERLQLYGVKPEKIILTGFPLPAESIDHKDIIRRITKLDPSGTYQEKHKDLLSLYFGATKTTVTETATTENKPLTITFAIGGAGAQSEIGILLMRSLHEKIEKGEVRLNLLAGTSKKILDRFEESLKKLKLEPYRNNGVSIIYRADKFEYFTEFNKILKDTDILWTKPSELSFYTGLGLPIIMTPPIGTQEECNKTWLHMIGAGFEQYDPKYTNEWLFDWLESGWLAKAAVNGYLNAPKNATLQIEKIILNDNPV